MDFEDWPQRLCFPFPLVTFCFCFPHFSLKFLRRELRLLLSLSNFQTSSVGSISSQPSGGGLRLLLTLGITEAIKYNSLKYEI